VLSLMALYGKRVNMEKWRMNDLKCKNTGANNNFFKVIGPNSKKKAQPLFFLFFIFFNFLFFFLVIIF